MCDQNAVGLLEEGRVLFLWGSVVAGFCMSLWKVFIWRHFLLFLPLFLEPLKLLCLLLSLFELFFVFLDNFVHIAKQLQYFFKPFRILLGVVIFELDVVQSNQRLNSRVELLLLQLACLIKKILDRMIFYPHQRVFMTNFTRSSNWFSLMRQFLDISMMNR